MEREEKLPFGGAGERPLVEKDCPGVGGSGFGRGASELSGTDPLMPFSFPRVPPTNVEIDEMISS